MKTKLHICYICVGRPRSSPCVFFLVGGSVSESSKGPDYLTLLVFLWSSYPLWGPQPFPLFFHKSPRAPSSVWLWVSTSV